MEKVKGKIIQYRRSSKGSPEDSGQAKVRRI